MAQVKCRPVLKVALERFILMIPCALNLADIMGADPIYLLGVDCNSVGKDQKNFHDEYELAGFDRAGDHQYESFKRYLITQDNIFTISNRILI